jgi:glycosyltransferase involved in cell wall biosynthesis
VDSPDQQQRNEQRATGKSSSRAASDRRPVVVLSANNCWNLVNFRGALLPALQKAGYRIVALAPLDAHAHELRRRGIEVQPVPIARSGMNPLIDARLLLRYIAALRALRPAVYCGFTIKPNVYGAIAARMTGVPAINNVTGLATPYLSKGLVWALAERLYRFAFKRSHTVFFHNQEDLDIMVARRVIRPGQGRVIPGSGVNLEHFKPAEDVSFEGPPRFLFIGRAIVHKGVREYVEAARRLRERMPEARFQLLGNPDPHNPTSVSDAEFRSWIDEGVIEHLGEHDDVRPFIRSATAVVLPTYREGMSRALLEGAAMGKPLVGSDVAGSRELVDEGVTGALCKARDSSSLADAMERIGRMPPEHLAAMGRAARDKVEREFSEELVVKAYLRAVDEVVRR